MSNKLYAVLMIVVLVIVVDAILIANQDTITKNIYETDSHSVTLANSTVITTPAPFLEPELQVQIWGLAPLGVVLGGAFAIFLLFFKR